jgi:hypothetical protein
VVTVEIVLRRKPQIVLRRTSNSGSIVGMANPEVLHGKLLWPNHAGPNPNAVYADVRAAALEEAQASVADGEMIFDLQVHGGSCPAPRARALALLGPCLRDRRVSVY